ncbi:MAG: choice-of-anchor D domain-containing protein, partial [Candidatus Latescibacteria bacterium]|nr:choice-of-anchor D domain-containing protein [Candidatus Latescibacterota bacterium]
MSEGTVTLDTFGEGIAPKIKIMPTTVHFNDIEIGNTEAASIMLMYEGDIDEVTSTLSSDSDAVTVIPETISLKSGESKEVTVTFTPILKGRSDNSITIITNGIKDGSVTVGVDGNGIAPKIAFSPLSIDFGNIEVGTLSTVDFTVTNNGNIDHILIDFMSDNNAFTVIPETVEINKGETKTQTLKFRPLTSGAESAVISAKDNITNEEILNIKSNGNGISPEITVTPVNIDFGNIQLHENASGKIIIKNDGTSNLHINDIICNRSEFVVGINSVTLSPNESIAVNVIFTPSKTGTSVDSIFVFSNDIDENVVHINVRGDVFQRSEVKLTPPAGQQTSEVAVQYRIIEPDNRKVDLSVMYQIDNDDTWYYGTVKEDLNSLDNYEGILTWLGSSDLAGYEGKVLLSVIPDNGLIEGIQQTVELYVDFNQPPVLEINSLTGEFSGDITVILNIQDAENDTVHVDIEYSLDGGLTYKPATVPEILTGKPVESKPVIWDTMKDLGYIYNQETILRLTPYDNNPGKESIAGPFTISNILGDYNHNGAIDSEDLLIFAEAWEINDITKEIGPVTGNNTPALKVLPDGKIDFEDLMVFALMWQWWTDTVNSSPEPAKIIPEVNAPWDGLRIITDGNGECVVVCNKKPDYLHLFVDSKDREPCNISIAAGEYWANYDNSIALTRLYKDGPVEFAAAQMQKDLTNLPTGQYNLALLRTVENEDVEELTVQYTIRFEHESQVFSGKITVPGKELFQKPDEFAIFQNTPNPFNPITTIEYTLPEESTVVLTIYNTAGQEVAVLVNDIETAGKHSVTWSAGNMPSGIYFYTIKTSGYMTAKKMLLLK